MCIDNARNNDCRNSNPISHLRNDRAGAPQARARDIRPAVPVNHNRRHDIHGDVPALEEEQGLRVVVRILELGDEREEGDVAGVGEYDVGDAAECCRERGDGRGLCVRIGALNADGDHGDQHGGEDRDESWFLGQCVRVWGECMAGSQEIERYETFFSVRGRVNKSITIIPTTDL